MTEQILSYTPISSIPKKVQRLRESFQAQKLHDVSFRLDQLRKLYYAVKEHEDELKTAIKLDLNKSEAEFELTELHVLYNDIITIINNLEKWVKPENVNAGFMFSFSTTKILKTPIGVGCVIGAFNFPLILSLQPVIAAISAGCPVVLKQSELVPYFTDALSEILENALDPDVLQIVNGAVEETTALLEQKFDKILYTGNGTVGKIVAKKAAETLTPVVLELGGKSPAFVTKGYNIDLAAKRIVSSKFGNAGQVCVAVDYVLVEREVYPQLVEAVIKYTKKYYNVDAKTSPKIVHEKAMKRLTDILGRSKGKVVYQGGEVDLKQRFFPPTVVKDVAFSDSLMEDEIFGPILPLIPYDNLDKAVNEVTRYHDTPLSLMIYSNSKQIEDRIISHIRSGSVLVGEGLLHVAIPSLPFGGIGTSGMGNYHGKHGFNTFSHDRAYVKQPGWVEPLFESKYPPVSDFDLKLAGTFMIPSKKFNKHGQVRFSWFFASIVALVGLVGFYFGRKT